MNFSLTLPQKLLTATCWFFGKRQTLTRSTVSTLAQADQSNGLANSQRTCIAGTAARHETAKAMVHARQSKPLRPMPLRVHQIIDISAPRSSGRLVISGRMADVCAELDRLAAREASLP